MLPPRKALFLWSLFLCSHFLPAAQGLDRAEMNDDMNMSDDDGMDADNDFCNPFMSMSMFMDGFHRSLNPHKKPPCLVYFVSGWLLDDQDKFKGAVVYSFLLAILMESLSAVRGAASHYVRSPLSRFLVLTLIYGVQGLLGYLLMFLAMTFSVEILLAAVVGLAVGNLAFFRYQDFQPHRKRRGHPLPPQQQQQQPGPSGGEREPLLSSSSSAAATSPS